MRRRYDPEQMFLIEIFGDEELRDAMAKEAIAYGDYEAACDEYDEANSDDSYQKLVQARDRLQTARQTWEKAARTLHEIERQDA